MEIVSKHVGENNTSINVLTADKAFKLNYRNRILCILLSISSLIIIILSCIIGYLAIDNNDLSSKNNQVCPESQINMTNSQGQVYNVENYYEQIITNTNEELNTTNIYNLVDDLILSLLDSLKEPQVWNADENITNNSLDSEENRRRRLAGFTQQVGGNGGSAFVLGKNNLRIKAICINSGTLIDAIEVSFSDNTWARTGGSGGSGNCYYANCFTSVLVKSGRKIDALVFVDSNGRMTGYKGGNGGSVNVFNFGKECLYQITGRSGSVIDAIRFYHN